MNNGYEKLFIQSIINVLENVAFIFPVPIEDTASDSCKLDGHKCICVDFQGPYQGKLFFCISESLSKVIAANMLGLDESEDGLEKKSIDASKEVVNIMCGNILVSLYGEEPVFDLGTPYLVEETERNLCSAGDYNITDVCLEVDGEIIKCIFAVKSKN